MRFQVPAFLLFSIFLAVPAFGDPLPSEDLSPPIPRIHTEAKYPETETARTDTVIVDVIVTVDAEGHVSEANVETSRGKAFDDAALAAIWQWEFLPALRGNKAMPSKTRVPFHFHPPKPKEPEAKSQPEPSRDTHGESRLPEDVLVRGRSMPPSRGSSDFLLHIGELSRVPRSNASDLLKLAPGILLTNEGGDGHAEQVFLRGFDAREGQDIEFSVNGVPINESGNLHANGYADTHFILPELVESLRVLEGPFDPRQGNYAVAGSADYRLGLAKRGITAKYTQGSFATNRLVLLFGPKSESRHTFGGAELYETNGYGQNRASKRASAMAQYEGSLGDRGTYRVFATAYGADFQSAGLLRAEDVTSGKKGFYDTYDSRQGGQSSRFTLSFDLEKKSGDATFYEQLFVTQRGMRIQENFTGFLQDEQKGVQRPHGQRGDLIDRDITSLTIGSRGWTRLEAMAFKQKQEAEVGYFARYDEVASTQYRVSSATNAPYQLDYDNKPKLVDVGLYADGNLRPIPKVSLRGGVRADLFTFNVLNGCAVHSIRRPSETNPPGDASCLSQSDFGVYREPVQRVTTSSVAIMPKATAIFGPWDGFTFSTSYGQGVRSIDPIYVYEDVKTPFARIDAYEGGANFSKSIDSVTLMARSIFFGTHVDHDLVFNQSEGRNTLADGTTRTGWIGALRVTGKWFDEAANITLVRSSFDDTGGLVPYVPDTVLRSDTGFHGDLPWKLSGETVEWGAGTGITFVGTRALPYGQRSSTIFTVDASGSLGWEGLTLELSGTNLFDQRYRLGEYNFASDFRTDGDARPKLVPARHFAAGAPRTLFISLSANIGGGP